MKWLSRRPVRAALWCFPVALLLYVAGYLAWSRSFAWESGGLWSFFPPPAGLVNLDVVQRYRSYGPSAWEGWQRLEKIPATVFGPCIWADDVLTGRKYLPRSDRTMCFN